MEASSVATKTKKTGARVKVVASRYAQALQSRNRSLESQRVRPPSAETPAAKQRGASPAAAASERPSSGLKERLKAFKASKAPLAPAPATTSASANAGAYTKHERNNIGSKPKSPTLVAAKLSIATAAAAAVRDRPKLPKRVERGAKKVASAPAPVQTTRPSSAGARTTSTLAAVTSTMPQTEQEELELLEALYYQLCFAELRAQQTFRQQEQSAERQICAAWGVLQSKLQLLHDTALRLDREKHAQLVERSVADQAASRLPDFVAALSSICDSMETSLHRLPTRGVRCDPHELQRLLVALGSELDGLLQHVQATKIDAKISDAVAFERGVEQAVDAMSTTLLQVANLAEELLREVSSETSMAIERIQQQRLETNSDWW